MRSFVRFPYNGHLSKYIWSSGRLFMIDPYGRISVFQDLTFPNTSPHRQMHTVSHTDPSSTPSVSYGIPSVSYGIPSVSYGIPSVSSVSYSTHTPTDITYQRMTPIEHVLARPDTYVGTTQQVTQDQFILQSKKEIRNKEIRYTPAFYKIIDELLMNAVDNHNRSNTTELFMDITSHDTIKIRNNGKNIPIQLHETEQIYIPELCFGHLLSGSNFNDEEIKYTGGRNGYGAKLANIFSKRFQLSLCDGKKEYKQLWENNMQISHKPIIKKSKSSPYLEIELQPDYMALHNAQTDSETPDSMHDEFLHLLYRRMYDIAACNPKLSVYINGKKIAIHSFQDYVSMFYKKKETIFSKKINDNWTICLGPRIKGSDLAHVSFVNSIATFRGGSHLQYVMNQICRYVIETIQKTNPDLSISPFQVQQHFSLFLNCRIENPTFDSQTKETLTVRFHQFREEAKVPETFLKRIVKDTDIVNKLVSTAIAKKQKKESKEIKQFAHRKRLSIPKLEDANWSGTSKSHLCTLIVTEGDSAKALAVSGLSVVGRDTFGVFPLKGKLLNVRGASRQQIENNEEIKNLRKIIGLQNDIDYSREENRKNLRYGKLMIMCDQDHDGSHIKGLIINLFDFFWPELLEQGFLIEFVTPIVKVKISRGKEISFYTLFEYQKWTEENKSVKHSVKYYKGLGTSTSKEAREYFSNLNQHVINLVSSDNREQDIVSIDLAFNKSKADERKDWLQELKPDTFLDHRVSEITIDDFVNQELILFSQASNLRAIPSVVDGLKPSQRKVLYSCLKKNLKNEMKVAQLSGYVGEVSAYHHGEASLQSTIVNMAQDFVGSNNLNLLHPSGQFGTRLLGGKDSASPRYIFTKLSKWTMLLFDPRDHHCLNYLEDDGVQIEPEHYLPIVPLVLLNGVEGIGTGWSTFIPAYNPMDVIENLKRKLKKKPLKQMHPWYRGYTGQIVQGKDGNYISEGVITGGGDLMQQDLSECKNVSQLANKTNSIKTNSIKTNSIKTRTSVTGPDEASLSKSQFIISDLPIHVWIYPYQQYLHQLIEKPSDAIKLISFKEYHTESKVKFVLEFDEETTKRIHDEIYPLSWLKDKLKLKKKISLKNMVLYNSKGELQRYSNALEILEEFYMVRLEGYKERKKQLASLCELEKITLENKVKFLDCIAKQKIDVVQMTGKQLEEYFVQNGFVQKDYSFDYLMRMPIRSLNSDQLNTLKEHLQQLQNELKMIQQSSPEEMWMKDLDALSDMLSKEWK